MGYLATAFADNFRLARSKVIVTPTAATYDVIVCPRFCFVRDVFLYVKAAGSATDVTVGMTGNGASADVDYFMLATETAIDATGWKRAHLRTEISTGEFVNVPFPGLWFDTAGGGITITFGTTLTTGILQVFADYTIIH